MSSDAHPVSRTVAVPANHIIADAVKKLDVARHGTNRFVDADDPASMSEVGGGEHGVQEPHPK